MQFAHRLDAIETSAIRELFKLLGQPGIISFAGGFPDAALFDLPGLQAASERALTQHAAAALQYGATEGDDLLREALAQLMRDKGAAVQMRDLIVTTGSQQALDLIGKTLISPGDKVIVEAPTFLATIQCFRLYGADLIGAPIDGEGVRVDELERLIVAHRPKLIYLIPTFGNPSGATLSLARRQAVLALAARHQVVVVEDDPYGDLYFQNPPPPSLLALSQDIGGSREHLVHCGSLSKVLAPGLRVGWLVAPPALLAKATMCKQFSDAHSSTLAQVTAREYLQSGRLGDTLARVRQVYAQRAACMVQTLREEWGDALRFVPPAGGLFVWARLNAQSNGNGANEVNGVNDAQALAQQAIARKVAFVPGAPFFCNQPDRSSLRLSFATASEDKIKEGLARLKQAWLHLAATPTSL